MSRGEMHRLSHGLDPDEVPGGIGTVRFVVTCKSDSERVLDEATSVLKIVASQQLSHWPTEEAWRRLLPPRFVASFADETTVEQDSKWLAKWRSMSPDEQVKADTERPWTLDEWTYWLQPEKRNWYWWGAEMPDPNTIIVAIEVEHWPFPWESLRRLFLACGAISVETDE